MGKRLLRVVAVAMVMCLTIVGAPIYSLQAEEMMEPEYGVASQQSEETTVDEVTSEDASADTEQSFLEHNGQNEAITEDVPSDVVVEEPSEEVTEETGSEDVVAEDPTEMGTEAINYIYIESPYLAVPDTQRIAVSLGSAYEYEQEFTMTVQNAQGETEEWLVSERSGHLLLFEKTYTEEWQKGTYQVISLNIGSDAERVTVFINDLGLDARFGVNEEYEGYSELVCIDGSSDDISGLAEAVEATVVTLDGLDEQEAEEKIEQAMSEAEELSTASPASSEGEQRVPVQNFLAGARAAGNNGNIVIALDPGHDANDAGACYGGLKEETLNLKIANYCKEELEKYEGVTIYMTRTSARCPYNCKSAGSCLEQRAAAAARAGAKFYVSFHLNASVSSAAKGAEIIVPNYSWKPEVGAQGRALAEKILNELVALGLNNRGIYSKNTTIGELYPDGSISDYFTAHCCNKEHGIPAIIVEHAFLTNSGDVNAFLRSEEGLKKLGVADANGIAKYLGLSKGRWETTKQGTFHYVNGKKDYGEKKINGEWYYFEPANDGAMKIGWYQFPHKTVYYRSDGTMSHGEELIDGKWYCFDANTGAMITGWHQLPTKKVYYNNSGQMIYGEQNIGGKWYYFDKITGAMKTGWHQFPKKKVYYDRNGQMVYGEQCIDGKWYLFDKETGAMQTGWYQFPKKTVYYNSDGSMIHGEGCIGGKWYYFDKITGEKKTGWINLPTKRVYYDANGVMVYGEQRINGKNYYFDKITGAMKKGWHQFPKKKVYYNSNGQMVYGEQCIGGKWYNFDKETGAMKIGWYQFPTKTVYYNSDGSMIHGEGCIDGKWYYFDKVTGEKKTGWINLPTKRVYYGANGVMLYGEQCINGQNYYFDKITGAMKTGWHQFPKKKVYYNRNGQMVYGEQLIDGKWYYFDKESGAMKTGWVNLPTKTVYYDRNGRMVYGERNIDGKWYYFDKVTGAKKTGWVNLPTKRVYYNSNGEMLYGQQDINGKTYYFDKVTGAMQRNVWIGKYYYTEDGSRGLSPEYRAAKSYTVMGTPNTTIDQMVNFYNNNKKVPYPAEQLAKGGAKNIEELANIFYTEAVQEGVRPEVAWAQSMLETDFLKFGNQVKVEQFNFAGLGATDNGAAGADFSSYGENGVRIGVRAQIQHLRAYADASVTKRSLAYTCVDPRFDLVDPKGSAPNLLYLGQKENPSGKGWATATEYGYNVYKLMMRLFES